MNRQQKHTQNLMEKKKVYIYAEVDIDRVYTQIISKSKKVRQFIESNNLDFDFSEMMRNYKNFRICFDNEIQQLIHKKQLSSDLRIFKPNVVKILEDFIIERYRLYNEDQQLHEEYKNKVDQIQEHFLKRIQELTKSLE